jgi:hypothetical protein
MAPPEEHLKYIREIMSRTSTFTAVPGWGAVLMGLSALIAAYVASQASTDTLWLLTWLADAVVAAMLGVAALMKKARTTSTSLNSGVGRKFITGLVPALFAGSVLTLAIWKTDQTTLLPGIWMLLYGIGTVTGGAYSVRIVPVMGMLFMAAGSFSLFVPHSWLDGFMAAAFGGLHVVFGYLIIRYHGG